MINEIWVHYQQLKLKILVRIDLVEPLGLRGEHNENSKEIYKDLNWFNDFLQFINKVKKTEPNFFQKQPNIYLRDLNDFTTIKFSGNYFLDLPLIRHFAMVQSKSAINARNASYCTSAPHKISTSNITPVVFLVALKITPIYWFKP